MVATAFPGVAAFRIGSVTENPEKRRDNAAGERIRFVAQVIPLRRPEIVATAAAGPAVVHSADFSRVSISNPTKPGEILSLWATGLGPTVPAVDPGAPFLANPLSVVNSPVELAVNGEPAEVIGAVGYPGSTDSY
jgi:uncharacterized protein (TIGR03437 family)